MKTTTLATEKLTLSRLLSAAGRDRAVFLTVRDNVRYVLLPADEGDQEVCALQNNAKFMAYLEDCVQRAKTGKRYSLDEIKAMYGLEMRPSRRMAPSSNGKRRSTRKTT